MGENSEDNQAKEPGVVYQSKTISIFMNQDQAAHTQRLSVIDQNPLQRIQETVELILRVFPKTKHKKPTNKIFIDLS